MGTRTKLIVALTAIGMTLVACQQDQRAVAIEKAATEQAAKIGRAQVSARRQSVVVLAQTLKDRMAQCTGGGAPSRGPAPRLAAAAWAKVERGQESRCTQLMVDLGSGKLFPPDWSDDRKASFQRALIAYAKYAAQNMARSQSEAMFMESVATDESANQEIAQYVSMMGAQSLEWRDRGEKLFRAAAKGYGVKDSDLRLPDS